MTATTERGRLLRDVTAEDWQRSRMGEFAAFVGDHVGHTYEDLWRWSIDEPDAFWRSIVEFFQLGVTEIPERVVTGTMPDVTWMPGARLNYARDALRQSDPGPAVIGVSQARDEIVLSWDELRAQVAACRTGLAGLGVGPGDAVAAYLPNIPETVVLFLATASLGAVFASCPPEFGIRAVTDRFGQVEPKVLVACDGYVYGQRAIGRTHQVAELVRALPGLKSLVLHEYVGLDARPLVAGSGVAVSNWHDLLADTGRL
jgi:acetoacetyl-CoA synthetase